MNLAAETHANVDIVRLGCLFHDIGKIITDEEGSHVDLGVKLLEKYNMPKAVVDCVAQHHEDVEFTSKESILVYISDAISGSRPGARYENVQEYVKRLTAIEGIAMSKTGVTEAYAISAGREVRVMVDPGKATDDEAVRLASDIRDEIKAKLTYPGTVTVTVIRETRAQQVAK
jgi:ribonuclease Y